MTHLCIAIFNIRSGKREQDVVLQIARRDMPKGEEIFVWPGRLSNSEMIARCSLRDCIAGVLLVVSLGWIVLLSHSQYASAGLLCLEGMASVFVRIRSGLAGTCRSRPAGAKTRMPRAERTPA